MTSGPDPLADREIPARCRLSGDQVAPLRQGDLDYLCGLYAIINAIRLLFAAERPLHRREVMRLYSRGIAVLAGQCELTCSMLASFDHRLWHALLHALVRQAQRITERTIGISQPLCAIERPSRAETFAVIEAAIHRGQPVLIELESWYHHYTVVSGYTPATLRLYDSSPLRRLSRRACGVDDEGPERHVITPWSLTVLTLA